MIQMRVEGGDKLAATLRQLSDRVSRSMLRDALRSVAAEPIRARASQLAPRAPGAPDLAEHIVYSNGIGKGGDVAVVVGPSKDTRTVGPMREGQHARTYSLQGMFVEFGTHHSPAQPFLRPAFDGEAPRAIGRFAGEVWSALARGGFSGTRGTSSGGGLL